MHCKTEPILVLGYFVTIVIESIQIIMRKCLPAARYCMQQRSVYSAMFLGIGTNQFRRTVQEQNNKGGESRCGYKISIYESEGNTTGIGSEEEQQKQQRMKMTEKKERK